MSTGSGTQASFSVIRGTEAQLKPETLKPCTLNLGFQQLALAVAKFRCAACLSAIATDIERFP